MKDFKDYAGDINFPLDRQRTYTPIFRNFDDNIITRLGVFIVEFVYPPVLIEDVLGKRNVEHKTNIKPFLLGLFIIMSVLFGIMMLVRWFMLYRESKRRDATPLYARENQSMNNQPPAEIIFNQQEHIVDQSQEEVAAPRQDISENIALYENNEPIINADPILVMDKVESALKVPFEADEDSHKIVTEPIAETEPITATEPIAATERVVRKRFGRQPLERKLGTTNTEAMTPPPSGRKTKREPIAQKIKVQTSMKNADNKSSARK